MRILAFAAVLASASLAPAASPALAQAVADGARAGVDSAEGTAPDGQPSPGGHQGEGQQAATSGSRMVKRGDGGATAPTKAETPDRP